MAAPPFKSSPKANKVHVLFIDDDHEFAELSKTYLEKDGWVAVDVCDRPEEALETIQQNNYDVVISDYQMPRCTGIDLLKTFRSVSFNIPVIIFTGQSREQVAIEALNLGAVRYIVKGGDISSQYYELLHAIEEVMIHKDLEAKLHQSRKMLQLVIDALPFYIFWKDRESVYLGCNQRFVSLKKLGDPSAVVGLTEYDLAEPVIADDHVRVDQLVMENATPIYKIGTRGKNEQGEEAYHETNKIPLTNPDGEVVGVLSTVEDVSHRKWMEEAVRSSEDRYRSLFEHSPAALWEEDFTKVMAYIESLKKEKGVTNFRDYFENNHSEVLRCLGMVKVLNVNQAALDMNEVKTKAELIGELGHLQDEENVDCFIEEFIALAEGKKKFETITSFKDNQGNRRYLQLNLSADVPSLDMLTSKVLVSVFDITERVLFEEELSHKAEELSSFAHYMAHDLSTHLSAINGLTALAKELSETVENQSTKDELMNLLAKISNQTSLAERILTRSLDLADSGLRIAKKSPVDLNAIVETVREMVVPETVQFRTKKLPRVMGDPEKIFLVFKNLVENAIVHGRPTEVEIGYALVEDNIFQVSFMNNGLTIPEETKPMIFDEGYSSTGFGKGLGLAIVRRIVDAHGWRLFLDERCEDVCFTVEIAKSDILNH